LAAASCDPWTVIRAVSSTGSAARSVYFFMIPPLSSEMSAVPRRPCGRAPWVHVSEHLDFVDLGDGEQPC
jgi:hypothetical protein